jgi:hypothetical protein
LVTPLGQPAQLIDLDQGCYADPGSVFRYARSCLLRLSDDSPYLHQPAHYLDAVTGAIAEAAGTSFLVALITARSMALSPGLVGPSDAGWGKGLPRLAADAMRADLDGRLGTRADQARDMLLPLAYAQGSGLPWEDVWPALIRALTGRRCGRDEFDWLIDVAGFYVVESTSDDRRRSTYRLYHEALAEHLRAGREDPDADHAAIVDCLTERTHACRTATRTGTTPTPTPRPT